MWLSGRAHYAYMFSVFSINLLNYCTYSVDECTCSIYSIMYTASSTIALAILLMRGYGVKVQIWQTVNKFWYALKCSSLDVGTSRWLGIVGGVEWEDAGRWRGREVSVMFAQLAQVYVVHTVCRFIEWVDLKVYIWFE